MDPMCRCERERHAPRLIVVTGGPGAGKTALLEIVRHHFCRHVAILPESASLLFKGGFPRRPSLAGRRAAQRAIVHVQRQLERLELDESTGAAVLCDRGTIDGIAYWPGDPTDFWTELGTTPQEELARYAAVIHLRPPSSGNGYNHENPVRTESAQQAHEIDERILEAWSAHPRRHVIESTHDFMEKVARGLEVIRAELPLCCREPLRPEVRL